MRGRAVGTDWEVYKHDSPPPFAKVQAISAVYFPQFCHFIDDLYETGTSYMVWSHKAEQKTISKDEQFDEGFDEAYNPYYVRRQTMLNVLQDFAHKEFR